MRLCDIIALTSHNHCNRPSHRNHRFLIIPLAVIIQSTPVSAHNGLGVGYQGNKDQVLTSDNISLQPFLFQTETDKICKPITREERRGSENLFCLLYIHKWKSYRFPNLSYWAFTRHQIAQKTNNSFMCKASTLREAPLKLTHGLFGHWGMGPNAC